MKIIFTSTFSLVTLLTLYSCTTLSLDPTEASSAHPVLSKAHTASYVKIHCYYQPNAQPYTGIKDIALEAMSFLESNLTELVENWPGSPQLIIPKDLTEMTEIAPATKNGYSNADVYTIALENHFESQSEDTLHFCILFLDAFFSQNDTIKSSVIGVHLKTTNILALFKKTYSPLQVVLPSDLIDQKYYVESFGPVFAEQSIIVHELGHAFGLVDLGIEAISDHHDHNNPGHCTNKSCIMYYKQSAWLSLFLRYKNIGDNESRILFGDECRRDIRAFATDLQNRPLNKALNSNPNGPPSQNASPAAAPPALP